MRRSYTLALEIVPTAPLTHGQGTEGNEQVLLTREVVVPDIDGSYERVEIPAVSGSSFKAALRQAAVEDALERAGVQDGELSKDVLRLLLKGGKNDSGGQSVSLDTARELRELFPLLAVFGSMDGGMPIRGAIQVRDVMPYCLELEAAGVLTRQIVPLHVAVDDIEESAVPAIELYPGVEPIPAHVCRTQVTYYRHDMRSSSAIRYLKGAERKQIEDLFAARKEKGVAKKDERREANESMPHSMQAIAPGTPMVSEIRLASATEAEWGCLVTALVRWIASGAHLGGAGSKGHGGCRVRIAGALEHRPAGGVTHVQAGTAIELPSTPEGRAVRAYQEHVTERKHRIREYLRSGGT